MFLSPMVRIRLGVSCHIYRNTFIARTPHDAIKRHHCRFHCRCSRLPPQSSLLLLSSLCIHLHSQENCSRNAHIKQYKNAFKKHSPTRELTVKSDDKFGQDDYKVRLTNLYSLDINSSIRNFIKHLLTTKSIDSQSQWDKAYTSTTTTRLDKLQHNLLQSKTPEIAEKSVRRAIQIDQLSQRDRAAGWVSYGQKWKTGTGRQYLRPL